MAQRVGACVEGLHRGHIADHPLHPDRGQVDVGRHGEQPTPPRLIRVGEPDGDACRTSGPVLAGHHVPVGEHDPVGPDRKRGAGEHPSSVEFDPQHRDRPLVAAHERAVVDLSGQLLVLERLRGIGELLSECLDLRGVSGALRGGERLLQSRYLPS